MGRPTKRTPKIVDRILAFVAEGRSIAAACGGELNVETFRLWTKEDPDLRERYVLARQASQRAMEERFMEEENPSRHNALKMRLGRLDPDSWVERRVNIDGGKMSIAEAAEEAQRMAGEAST